MIEKLLGEVKTLVKSRVTLTVDAQLVAEAHEKGLNISQFLEKSLRDYLNGSPQPQPQSTEQLNQYVLSLIPHKYLETFKAYGVQIGDKLLKRIVEEGAFSLTFECETKKELGIAPLPL